MSLRDDPSDDAMGAAPLLSAPLTRGLETDAPLDLRELDLREGLFAGADLRDADLRHARLDLADLRGARLQGARLSGADLTLAQVEGADLRGADLSEADLSGADLRQADLQGADLHNAELSWARVSGTKGMPEALRDRPRTAAGRVRGQTTGREDEPLAGLRAWERGRRAHSEGRIGEAERHYRLALGWVPDSDAVPYELGCVALDRRDPKTARRWFDQALRNHTGADRARLALATLELDRARTDAARALMAPLMSREGKVGEAASAFDDALLRQAPDEAVNALAALLPDGPAIAFYRHQRDPARPRPSPPMERPDVIDHLSDEEWVAGERADLEALLRDEGRGELWIWHGAIARAISIGAMDLAALAEQRLNRVAPEHRLWGVELKQLDLTAQAFEALVRTRRDRLGAVESIRWISIGAHGPTARLRCEGGEFYAKRYVGSLRPIASVAYTHRISRSFAEAGLRVPLPLGDREGDEVLVFGDDLLALYPDMGGKSVPDEDLPPEIAREMGSILGQLHELGDRLGLRGRRPRGGITAGSRVLRHPNPASAWQLHMALDARCASGYDQWATRSRLDSLLRATGRRLTGVIGRCRKTLVHGDFGPGNVLRQPSGQDYAVIDWDLCNEDLGVWDLARTIDRVAVHWPPRWGQPAEIRGNIARALLLGYEDARPLNDHERAALPILIAGSRVDLDASVLPLCMPIEPESAEPILAAMRTRLSRAAAGAPEIEAALSSG